MSLPTIRMLETSSRRFRSLACSTVPSSWLTSSRPSLVQKKTQMASTMEMKACPLKPRRIFPTATCQSGCRHEEVACESSRLRRQRSRRPQRGLPEGGEQRLTPIPAMSGIGSPTFSHVSGSAAAASGDAIVVVSRSIGGGGGCQISRRNLPSLRSTYSSRPAHSTSRSHDIPGRCARVPPRRPRSDIPRVEPLYAERRPRERESPSVWPVNRNALA